MISTFDDVCSKINFQDVSYDEFCNRLGILNISDRSGTFAVRSNLSDFLDRVANKPDDTRKQRVAQYTENLYKMLVVEPEQSLYSWFKRYGELPHSVDFYFDMPDGTCLDGDTFVGIKNSKYGRICKNINFDSFYNTKKLYTNDSEYIWGLIIAMYERFHLRNSLASPAFFDHICKMQNYDQVWLDFMIGANKASIFNPYTYRSILDDVFEGDTLFAPCMGWNAYQLGFYSSKFQHMITTDVIPDVVENTHWLHQQYCEYYDKSPMANLFSEPKIIDAYLCPSEQLEAKHNFVEKYSETVDAVLFSPPYFDLEIYPGEEQSTVTFPDYTDWLSGYWEETVKLCSKVLKPGKKFAFVISNYRNHTKEDTTISKDMKEIVEKHLDFDRHYKVRWSAMSSGRQAQKQRDGNFEDLWVFKKG